MYNNFPTAHSHINNSFELVNRLSHIHIDNSYSLISLDVVSLFTNVPTDLALESISSRWQYLSEKCDISRSEFLNGVQLVLSSTFFTFNGKVYRQTFGTPMGSPLSPIIANLVLQDLENKALESLSYVPSIYIRFVDDILMAVPTDSITETLNIFNSFHTRLQFTLEIENNRSLNLDISIIVENNTLIYNWYHKPTFSGRYLNYYSQHPLCQKKGTIIGLTDRAFLLSHPRFHIANLKLIVNILLNNNYPLLLIFQTINHRLNFLINNSIFKKTTKNSPQDNCFSYHIYQAYQRILKK